MSPPRQGDVWWGETPAAKRRPYVIITRDEAIPVLQMIVVAPVTRTVRGIESELPLGPEEGLPMACAATFDNLTTMPKGMLVARAGSLARGRRHELCAALRAAADC